MRCFKNDMIFQHVRAIYLCRPGAMQDNTREASLGSVDEMIVPCILPVHCL